MLSNACVEAVANAGYGRENLLEHEFRDNSKIQSLLSNYHSGAHVSYFVRSVDVDKSGVGYLSVNYTVHRYSACKDKDLDEDHDMDFEVNVNMVTTEATLSGEDIAEREPDTY
jgi:hypothetical protein